LEQLCEALCPIATNGYQLGDVADFKHKNSIELLMLTFHKCFIEALQVPYCQTDVGYSFYLFV